MRCAAKDGSHAARTRTLEVQAVVAVGLRVRPHEREAAFKRVRVADLPIGVVQPAAPQDEKPRGPLFRQHVLRCEALQRQVKAQQRRVLRPICFAVDKRIRSSNEFGETRLACIELVQTLV